VADDARRAELKAIVLKSHHESTVSRAYLLNTHYPGLEVFGGIVLNRSVGGINPEAVEACLRLGGKVVWMPTIDSESHRLTHSRVGERTPGRTVSILQGGEPRPELVQVFELVARHEAVLATGHLSVEEIAVLIPAAKEYGVRKIVITHPFSLVPGLDLSCLRELVAMGAKAEFAWYSMCFSPLTASPSKVANATKALGAERCLLVSDTGQEDTPPPTRALGLFLDWLAKEGVGKAELDVMTRANPAQLLGLALP